MQCYAQRPAVELWIDKNTSKEGRYQHGKSSRNAPRKAAVLWLTRCACTCAVYGMVCMPVCKNQNCTIHGQIGLHYTAKHRTPASQPAKSIGHKRHSTALGIAAQSCFCTVLRCTMSLSPSSFASFRLRLTGAGVGRANRVVLYCSCTSYSMQYFLEGRRAGQGCIAQDFGAGTGETHHWEVQTGEAQARSQGRNKYLYKQDATVQ